MLGRLRYESAPAFCQRYSGAYLLRGRLIEAFLFAYPIRFIGMRNRRFFLADLTAYG